MPELPEVETTRQGLLPHVVGRRIRGVVVRNPNLRWPVPSDLSRRLEGEEVVDVRRRGKYLVFDCRRGHLLVHLGMSGRLTLVPEAKPAQAHDHVDVRFEGARTLRLTDPRRFGAMLWVSGRAEDHALLRGLGLEPLDEAFTGLALHEKARGRRVAVKHFLMDSRIHPLRSAGRISRARWDRLAASVRSTLERAIEAGGTTLRDFASAEGRPGRYGARCAVYGREGKPCRVCGASIRAVRQGQQSTFYCPACQR
jgi:formamidopyrimidine-DNA glycosylase